MIKGMIIAWYGSIATIPDGWAWCNGTNGTPDFRNRFLQGTFAEFGVGLIGGETNHNHPFTGDGHTHIINEGFFISAGPNWDRGMTTDPAVGTTNNTFTKPPFYNIVWIMKLNDDPDILEWLAWPYAAKAIIQHTFHNSILEIWLTFRHKMNQDNKPADGLWLVEADEVPEAITSSAWVDEWTMKLTIDPLAGYPEKVTVEYDGPDENLATTWDKQWEPWGAIPSIEIPTPAETITINTGPADQDDVNVSGVSVIFLDCSGSDIVIGGFIGGVNGQVLHIARLCATANDGTIRHNKATGNQRILLHAGADETINGEYGGWALMCNGTNWFDTSHSKHV